MISGRVPSAPSYPAEPELLAHLGPRAGISSRGPRLTALGCPFTDAQLAAIVEASKSWQVGQIQGFRYGKRLVIRDCMRKPGQQEIWEGVADRDDDAFYRQCEIEQLRAAIAIGLAETEPTAAGVPVRGER